MTKAENIIFFECSQYDYALLQYEIFKQIIFLLKNIIELQKCQMLRPDSYFHINIKC